MCLFYGLFYGNVPCFIVDIIITFTFRFLFISIKPCKHANEIKQTHRATTTQIRARVRAWPYVMNIQYRLSGVFCASPASHPTNSPGSRARMAQNQRGEIGGGGARAHSSYLSPAARAVARAAADKRRARALFRSSCEFYNPAAPEYIPEYKPGVLLSSCLSHWSA